MSKIGLSEAWGDIEHNVKKIMVEHLGVDGHKATLEAKIIDDLGADSLDCVELVMAVEETFLVEISDDQAEQCQTLGDIVKLLRGMSDDAPDKENMFCNCENLDQVAGALSTMNFSDKHPDHARHVLSQIVDYLKGSSK